jgi:hypothetical protein
VGIALLKKLKHQRRASAPAVLQAPSQEILETEQDIAQVGFHRFVYQKLRIMREDLFDTRYKSLKEAAQDIRHAVRVCLLAKRFISEAKSSCLATKGSEAKHTVAFEPRPPKGNTSLDTVARLSQLRKFSGSSKSPVCGAALLQQDEPADRKWLSLLEDLTPMTPMVTSF